MGYPIKFRIVRKDTCETFKQWAIRSGESQAGRPGSFGPRGDFKLRPVIDTNGQILAIDYEDFYLGTKDLCAKDWRLEVALDKAEGKWVYKQVGW